LSDVTQRATDTIVPQSVRVTLGSGEEVETYTINSFCLAKTIRTFTYLSDLGGKVGLSDAVGAVADTDASSGGVLPGLIKRALAVLPTALRDGEPSLYMLLGVLVTSNAKLRRMDEDGEDIDGFLLKTGKGIAYTASNDQIIDLFVKSVQVIGVATIVKNLPALMGMLGATR
jgi:hypothetical protein